MTNRFESRLMKTTLAGLSLAVLGAVMLFAMPHGAGTAEAAQKAKKMCARDGAVADAANNPGLVSDCAILLNVKDVLRGSEGNIRTLNWSASLPMSRWNGVILGGSPPRVTKLHLQGMGLRGSIPPRLGRLSKLEHLTLCYNQLSGSIPKQLGNLANLEDLLLANNQLSGSIPKQLGKLSDLTRLWLGSNQLSGEIPRQLGKLSNLENLWLTHNQLSGSIPKQLGTIPSLRSLELYANNLSGCVPETLRDLRDNHYFGHTVMFPPGETDYAPSDQSWRNVRLPWCGDVD